MLRSPLILVALAGCAPSLAAVQVSSDVPGLVHVQLQELRGDLIVLDVANQSQAPLLVNRDAILLKTPRGPVHRESEGTNNTYTLAPGGHHQVNLRYLMGNLADGETAQLVFDQAFTPPSGGPVTSPPLVFKKN